MMKANARESKALSRLLGDDHDLLEAVLADEEVTRDVAADVGELLELIAHRREELLAEDPRARPSTCTPTRPRRSAGGCAATSASRSRSRRRPSSGSDEAMPAGVEVERKFLVAARPAGLDDHPSQRDRAGLPRRYTTTASRCARGGGRRSGDAHGQVGPRARAGSRRRWRSTGGRFEGAVAADRGAPRRQDPLPRPARGRPDRRGR